MKNDSRVKSLRVQKSQGSKISSGQKSQKKNFEHVKKQQIKINLSPRGKTFVKETTIILV